MFVGDHPEAYRVARNLLAIYPRHRRALAGMLLYQGRYTHRPRVTGNGSNLPDLILSFNRVRLFRFDAGTVQTFARDERHQEMLRDEYRTKQQAVDAGINTPHPLSYSDEDGLRAEYVNVSKIETIEPTDPILHDAIQQLRTWYEHTGTRTIDTSDYLQQLREEFPDEFEELERIVRYVERHAPQEVRLTTAHGDFFRGNIGKQDGEAWLFDWEQTREKSMLYDVIYLLEFEYEQEGMPAIKEVLRDPESPFQSFIDPIIQDTTWEQRRALIVLSLLELVANIHPSLSVWETRTSALDEIAHELIGPV